MYLFWSARTELANQVSNQFKVFCESGKGNWFDEADAHNNDYVFSENSKSGTDTEKPEIVEETDTGSNIKELEGKG